MSGVFPNSGVPASQALNSVDIPTINCDGELFHDTSRCQPRFDPSAANALISEVLNAISGLGITYDCSKLDNLLTALLGCGGREQATIAEMNTAEMIVCVGGVQKLVSFVELMTNSCLNAIPDLGVTCGTIEQLVLINDGGCKKVARYSTAASTFATMRFDEIVGVPDETFPVIIPDDMPNPAALYLRDDFLADGALGAANFVELNISSKVILRETFTLTCPRLLTINAAMIAQRYVTVQEAYDRTAALNYRYRVNGGAWVYPRDGAGNATTLVGFNGVNILHTENFNVSFPSGIIDFEMFYLAGNATPLQLVGNTITSSGSSPRGTIFQDV